MAHQQQRTNNNRDDAHAKGWRQPMPKCQMIFRQFPTDNRTGRRSNQRPGNHRREQADQNHQNRQQCRRAPHAKGWIMWMMRQVLIAWLAQPDVENKAEGVRHREDCPNGGQKRHNPALIQPHGVPCFFKHHFLGQEPVQRNNPGHRCRRDNANRPGNRHQVEQPAQTTNITGPGFMVDNTGRHKQGRLKRCMVDDVKHTSHGSNRRSKAKQHGNKTKVADRRIGQKSL